VEEAGSFSSRFGPFQTFIMEARAGDGSSTGSSVPVQTHPLHFWRRLLTNTVVVDIVGRRRWFRAFLVMELFVFSTIAWPWPALPPIRIP